MSAPIRLLCVDHGIVHVTGPETELSLWGRFYTAYPCSCGHEIVDMGFEDDRLLELDMILCQQQYKDAQSLKGVSQA